MITVKATQTWDTGKSLESTREVSQEAGKIKWQKSSLLSLLRSQGMFHGKILPHNYQVDKVKLFQSIILMSHYPQRFNSFTQGLTVEAFTFPGERANMKYCSSFLMEKTIEVSCGYLYTFISIQFYSVLIKMVIIFFTFVTSLNNFLVPTVQCFICIQLVFCQKALISDLLFTM